MSLSAPIVVVPSPLPTPPISTLLPPLHRPLTGHLVQARYQISLLAALASSAPLSSRYVLSHLALTANESLGRYNDWLQDGGLKAAAGCAGAGAGGEEGELEQVVRMWEFELYSIRRFVLSLVHSPSPHAPPGISPAALYRIWTIHDFLRNFPTMQMAAAPGLPRTEEEVAQRFLELLMVGEILDANLIPGTTLQSFLNHLTSHPPFYTLCLAKGITLDTTTFEHEEERTWGGAVLRARGVGGIVWRGGGKKDGVEEWIREGVVWDQQAQVGRV